MSVPSTEQPPDLASQRRPGGTVRQQGDQHGLAGPVGCSHDLKQAKGVIENQLILKGKEDLEQGTLTPSGSELSQTAHLPKLYQQKQISVQQLCALIELLGFLSHALIRNFYSNVHITTWTCEAHKLSLTSA